MPIGNNQEIFKTNQAFFPSGNIKCQIFKLSTCGWIQLWAEPHSYKQYSQLTAYNKFTWTLEIKIIQWISIIWFQIYCQGAIICHFRTQRGTMVFLIAQRHLFTLDYFQMQLLLKGLESDPFFHSAMTKKAQKPRTGKELI